MHLQILDFCLILGVGRCSPEGSHLILPDTLICIITRITGGELKNHQFTVEQSLAKNMARTWSPVDIFI